MTLIFDTLKLTKQLERGFSREQANVIAEALRDSTEQNVATKSDIQEVRAEIAALRGEMKFEIASVRNEIAVLRTDVVRWIVTGIALNFLGTAGLLLAFAKGFAK